jgi:hypothetical protein
MSMDVRTHTEADGHQECETLKKTSGQCMRGRARSPAFLSRGERGVVSVANANAHVWPALRNGSLWLLFVKVGHGHANRCTASNGGNGRPCTPTRPHPSRTRDAFGVHATTETTRPGREPAYTALPLVGGTGNVLPIVARYRRRTRGREHLHERTEACVLYLGKGRCRATRPGDVPSWRCAAPPPTEPTCRPGTSHCRESKSGEWYTA